MTGNRDDLESFWRNAWRAYIAQGRTIGFHDILDGIHSGEFQLNSGGSVSSLGKGSSSHSNAPPAHEHRTTVQAERLALECLRRFEGIESELELTERSNDNDDAINTESLARFAAHNNGADYRHDFSCYRA